MSKYTITIAYTGPVRDTLPVVNPICRIFAPQNSYADTAAYAGTVYDTNVDGFGVIDLMEPYATTSFPFPVPLAQFKVAMLSDNGSVTFEVDSYMEAFYYTEAGKALAAQGFTVTAAAYPSITLDKTELSVVKSTSTGRLTAFPNPADATVDWASSDTGVATVSDGVITAGSSAGTCTITASITVDNVTVTAECALTVTNS